MGMKRGKGILRAIALPVLACSIGTPAYAVDVPFDNDPLSGSILISRADGLLGWVKQSGGTTLFGVAAANNQGAGTVNEIAIGDLDGDGNGDILTARNAGATTWTERNGNNLSGVTSQGIPSTTSIAVGDLDGDGDGDLVLGWALPDFHVTWMERTAGNTLTSNTTVSLGGNGTTASPLSLAIGDLDGDGDGDVVVNRADGQLRWLERSGTTLATVFTGFNVSPAVALEIGNLDNDGDGDIVIGRADGFVTWAERSGNNITGGGGLANPSFNLGSIADLALADVNGDGDDEIIVAQSALGGSVFILDHNGSSISVLAGPFTAAGAGVSIKSLDVGDLDGDGFLDIVVGKDDGVITWMEATAGGTAITGVTSFNAGFGSDLRIASLVPEPASLALLGLGGLVTLRRR